jgi:HEAT repeat protein
LSRRIPIITLAALLAACASSSKSPTGLQQIEVDEIEPVKIVEEEAPIGMFLADLDKTMRAWTNLTHTANTPKERRQARQLELVLRHGASKRADELIQQLETGPPRNRVRAASALGFSGSAEALSPLLAALSDTSLDVVHNALLGLALLADPDTPVEPICKLMETSTDPHTRSNAAYALRNVIENGGDGQAARNSARLALVDPEALVRVQAALILGLAADHNSIKPLADSIYDEVPLVGKAAVEALTMIALDDGTYRGPVARSLVRALDKADSNARHHVRRALIEIADRDYGREVADWNEWAQRLP